MRPEDKFQADLILFAQALGWRAVHFRPARVLLKGGKVGWRTPVQGDGKGFLDTIFVRERVVWAELKTDSGALTAEQEMWLAALRAAKQEAYCWHLPRDLDEAAAVLRRREE